jgi:hypothetical protein
LEGTSSLDLGGVHYSFILFQTSASKGEVANVPSGIGSLSEGDAFFRAGNGEPEALGFMKSLHDYVTEKKDDLAIAATERRNLLKIQAAEEKAEKAKPKTVVIRYWTRKNK